MAKPLFGLFLVFVLWTGDLNASDKVQALILATELKAQTTVLREGAEAIIDALEQGPSSEQYFAYTKLNRLDTQAGWFIDDIETWWGSPFFLRTSFEWLTRYYEESRRSFPYLCPSERSADCDELTEILYGLAPLLKNLGASLP